MSAALGIIITLFLVGISFYLQSQKDEVKKHKLQHPAFVFFVIVVFSFYLLYQVGAIVVFLFALALPTFFVLLHASLRQRNIKNQIQNKIIKASEALGLGKKTPMGVVLKEIVVEPKIIAK